MPNNRDRIPDDDPAAKIFRDIDVERTKAEIDTIFDFERTPLERDDIGVSAGSVGAAKVEPEGYLGDEKFESFTEQARESEKLNYNPMDKSNYAVGSELDTPRPLDVHASRDPKTRRKDVQRKAKVTTDPEKYARDPGRYDYPFIDTPAEFNDEYENEMFPFSKFQRMAGEDDIFEW